MRWALLLALALLVVATAWWLSAEPEAVKPLPAPAITAEPESEAAPAPAADAAVAIAQSPTTAAVIDAGPPKLDVLVEVFGAEGHAPGAAISFHGRVVDKYAALHALRDPNADFGPEVGGGRTDVMGFTHALLPVGRWRVKPPAEPAYVQIRGETREVALRLRAPDVLRGLVIDEHGQPVPHAPVAVLRDLPDAERFRGWSSIPMNVGKDGRFQYSTFDSSLTLLMGNPDPGGEPLFRKHVNLPCPEVKLYFGKLAQLDLEIVGPGRAAIGVEYETMGITSRRLLEPSRLSLTVIPGHVLFRGRAVFRDHRLAGAGEADVKAGEHKTEKLTLVPVRGQEIHVYDPEQNPVPSVQVLLKNAGSAAAAKTDTSGVALFEPGTSGAGKVEVTGLCVDPGPLISLLDDAASVTVRPCPPPDSGEPLEDE